MTETFARYCSPLGPIGFKERDGVLVKSKFFSKSKALGLKEDRNIGSEGREDIKRLFALLDRYFSGKRVDFSGIEIFLGGSDFEEDVWRALMEIPYGEVRSYKEIASAVGSPKAARAVGSACGRNPLPIIVPCHRVVPSSGGLGGYTLAGGGGREEGQRIKRGLLKVEGVSL